MQTFLWVVSFYSSVHHAHRVCHANLVQVPVSYESETWRSSKCLFLAARNVNNGDCDGGGV